MSTITTEPPLRVSKNFRSPPLISSSPLVILNELSLIAANFSAIRVHRAVVFRSTISRCKVENALFKVTAGEGSNECSMFFVEKEMLPVSHKICLRALEESDVVSLVVC